MSRKSEARKQENRVCIGCGCTDTAPCLVNGVPCGWASLHPCGWASLHPPLCTACAQESLFSDTPKTRAAGRSPYEER